MNGWAAKKKHEPQRRIVTARAFKLHQLSVCGGRKQEAHAENVASVVVGRGNCSVGFSCGFQPVRLPSCEKPACPQSQGWRGNFTGTEYGPDRSRSGGRRIGRQKEATQRELGLPGNGQVFDPAFKLRPGQNPDENKSPRQYA